MRELSPQLLNYKGRFHSLNNGDRDAPLLQTDKRSRLHSRNP